MSMMTNGKLPVRDKDGNIDTSIVTGPGITKQAFTDECDINKIIAKYDRSGMVTHLNESQPFYGDVSEYKDLKASIDKVNSANELFMEMSAEVRNKFDNDPVKMVEFLLDSKNKAEAIQLGMIMPEPEQEKPKAEDKKP